MQNLFFPIIQVKSKLMKAFQKRSLLCLKMQPLTFIKTWATNSIWIILVTPLLRELILKLEALNNSNLIRLFKLAYRAQDKKSILVYLIGKQKGHRSKNLTLKRKKVKLNAPYQILKPWKAFRRIWVTVNYRSQSPSSNRI